jgi:hypothetical protein
MQKKDPQDMSSGLDLRDESIQKMFQTEETCQPFLYLDPIDHNLDLKDELHESLGSTTTYQQDSIYQRIPS